jgi:glutamine synthetase
MSILSDIGVEVKYGHSEVGYVEANTEDDLIWEQHEIELALTPLLQAADAVVLTQWVLRNLAHSSGMRCSFDPIVRKGHAGSGLHFHFSPTNSSASMSVIQGEEALAEEARWLIGGLIQMSSSLMAFGNRRENSFIRLNQGKESPHSITWGRHNRHALIRLPLQARTEEGRVVTQPTIEYRLPDGSAHPYLILAGVVQAMLMGRETEDLDGLLQATEVSNNDLDQVEGTAIPASFAEVASALEEHSHNLTEGEVFPEELISYTRERLRSGQAQH